MNFHINLEDSMEHVAGEQGLALQQIFPNKSAYFFDKISFYNTRGLKLGYFDFSTCHFWHCLGYSA